MAIWPFAIAVFAEFKRWPYRATYRTANTYFFPAAEVAIKLLKFLFLYDQLILQWRYGHWPSQYLLKLPGGLNYRATYRTAKSFFLAAEVAIKLLMFLISI